MKTEKGLINGDLVIKDAVDLLGMLTGNAHVYSNAVFFVHGMCCKNLIIEPGGKAKIYGMVNGNVSNEGGELEIYGVVGGSVTTSKDGTTFVDSNAVINRC